MEKKNTQKVLTTEQKLNLTVAYKNYISALKNAEMANLKLEIETSKVHALVDAIAKELNLNTGTAKYNINLETLNVEQLPEEKTPTE